MGGEAALAYYADGPDLTEVVLDALRSAGRSIDPIDPDDLAALDEFHGLGRAATVAMARKAGIGAGTQVLDIGAGIGGPARTLTRHFGARVTAIDPTERFCALNSELTRRAGMGESISIVHGDGRALPFEDGSFEVTWTQAVWQSVEDKRQLLSEARRVLAVGGRAVCFEVLAGPAAGEGLHLPVPWATTGGESHLVTPDEARALVESAGFEVAEWLEGMDAAQAIGEVAAAGGPELAPGAEGVSLALVMPDFDERMAGLARNVADQRVTLLLAVLGAV
jgi:SAM-dependent methyltransferase